MKKLEFKNIKRKAVDVRSETAISLEFLENNATLPLIIKPAIANLDLAEWTCANRDFIDAKLLKHGAILLRDFQITTAPVFERFGLAICSELFNENGEHPRETVSGNVYTPVFYPSDRKLLWHNENSFNHFFPQKILFACRQPAQEGGETPIVDSRKVFELLNPKIKKLFLKKKVMYLRNYSDRLGLNWQKVFQTNNKAEVETRCRQAFIDFDWRENRLRTRSIRPAAVKHPKTGEMTWFTQAQHWHPACLDEQTRQLFKSSFQAEDLPRNCYYGDGTFIEDSVMEEICNIYQQLEVTFSWKKGDVLVLDNLLTAHGRNPFVGERQLLVAMGDMMSFADIEDLGEGK
ncbi:taurine catabolism dioxygenase TauD [Hydrococcus rivularis NIES-593]|uniref:Taurine catabolism dioxygenase TauD n=1 Tax=Hydrococcus rivularis NIES-593 TaxID=1921803 RepID=A0A1U7HBH7_9CYAN|nr:TauD/TfdA family dioxygenase [Hydrococcus rivularis]OKH20888.1 taurine catabolism dioxygenase TauD [Hydrococcus rivularis NIES-593]